MGVEQESFDDAVRRWGGGAGIEVLGLRVLPGRNGRAAFKTQVLRGAVRKVAVTLCPLHLRRSPFLWSFFFSNDQLSRS